MSNPKDYWWKSCKSANMYIYVKNEQASFIMLKSTQNNI